MPISPVPEAITESVEFGASWSRSTRLLTLVFLLCGVTVLALSYTGSSPSVFFYFMLVLIGAAVGVAFWFAPIGYQVDTVAVAVRRRAGAREIPLQTMKAARLMEPAELAESTWRWPAVGGLFGFYGTFETPSLGRHRWYASRDENLVLLQTAKGPVVLSPDQPEVFVREVNQRLRASHRI